MKTDSPNTDELPFKGNLSTVLRLSALVSLLLVGVSLASLFDASHVYPGEELFVAFIPNDVLNLALVLPVLLLCLWSLHRGGWMALLSLPGLFFYVLYIYVMAILGVPFNYLFLPYLLLIILSVCGLLYLLLNIDSRALKHRLAGRVHERVTGGVLICLAAMTILRQVSVAVAALLQQKSVPSLEYMLLVDDLVLNGPAMLLGGIFLWRRKSIGYVVGAGLLLQYGLLAAGLVPVLLFQAAYRAVAPDVPGIVVVACMAAFCLLPYLFFVKATARPGGDDELDRGDE